MKCGLSVSETCHYTVLARDKHIDTQLTARHKSGTRDSLLWRNTTNIVLQTQSIVSEETEHHGQHMTSVYQMNWHIASQQTNEQTNKQTNKQTVQHTWNAWKTNKQTNRQTVQQLTRVKHWTQQMHSVSECLDLCSVGMCIVGSSAERQPCQAQHSVSNRSLLVRFRNLWSY